MSVIVPCYNGGRFIDGLLATLATQTFRDFEVIIVNDGSTDEVTRRKLGSINSAVCVLHQENRHVAAARNAGIRHARGEFVLPLDCDDMLDPSFLANTVPLLRAAPPEIGFVFTHMRLTHMLHGILPRRFNSFDQMFLNQLPYCMLLRRSAWEAVGGYDERMTDGSEDWEFNIRLANAGLHGIEVPKPLFVYRVSSEGLLLSHTVRRQGNIWRYIRRKHADLYRVSALAALWQATRASPGKISALTAVVLLGMAMLLPDSWFDKLYHWMFLLNRSRRITRGEMQEDRR